MKKKILIFCLAISCFLLFFSLKTKAITYDDSSNAGYEVTKHQESDLYGGVTYINDWGNTIKQNKSYSQQVNVLTMKTHQEAKVVTWAANNGSGFVRKTIANLARDYEVNHPGWKVIGGINADQYYTKYGEALGVDGSDYFYPQPYYPMIADYEKWFAMTATPSSSGNIVGFTNDGSADQLIYYNAALNYGNDKPDKAKIKGLYLTVDGQKFLIENVNKVPNANESSLYSPYYVGSLFPNLSVTGTNLFIVEKADLAYMSNSVTYTYKQGNNKDAFFGKGEISAIGTNASLKQGQFAIDTKNPEILNALSVGKYIIVQYEFEGPLNEVEAGIGFHFTMRVDNVDRPMSGSYNTQLYPRTMFGRKADGTIVFVTVDGRQASAGMNGVDVQEGNAILKHYGVVEAYQVDGGGSVTMIIRDGDSFKTVNSPSDGADRSVLSALFLVVKDPDIRETVETIANKLKFNVTTSDESIKEIYVKLNEETKQVSNGSVEFTNLSPNTEYSFQYLYKKDAEVIPSIIYKKFMTAKRTPELRFVIFNQAGSSIDIKLDLYDPDKAITRKSMDINDETHFLNQNTLTIPLTTLNFDQMVVYLSYDLNDGKGRQDVTMNDFKISCNLVAYMENIKNILKEKVKVYE